MLIVSCNTRSNKQRKKKERTTVLHRKMMYSSNARALALVGLLLALTIDSSISAKIIPRPLAPAESINTPRLVDVARDALDNNEVDGTDIL